MHWPLHQRVLALALPMVISNITVPLLGLVDIAVIGHLEHSWYLGGVALGSTMISMVFWLFGFLRMSTTGLTSQAVGGDHKQQSVQILLQGLAMALSAAAIFLLLHSFISEWVFTLFDASDQVKYSASEYFSIRAWSAPASLANFVILGWLLGFQNAKGPMWMVIVTNICNIIFDVWFVIGLELGVSGAAFASVIADYMGLAVGIVLVAMTWQRAKLPRVEWRQVVTFTQNIGRFIKLNGDIFLRSLSLQLVFAFMNFKAAEFGDDTVAGNAVLMSLLMSIAYAMDGLAYAIEAMVGKAIGAKNRSQLGRSLIGTFFWGAVIGLSFTLLFMFAGKGLISLLTDITVVRLNAEMYLPWLIAMPIVSMWCFLFDGVAIGATRGREMRNTMFIASGAFFIVYMMFQDHANHALWGAMLTFMAMRGLTLGVIMTLQYRRQEWITSQQ